MLHYRKDRGFQFRITTAVKYLIVINTGIFIAELLFLGLPFDISLSPVLGLAPALFWRGALWQPVTYMFLHGGMFHLLINMFILWMFGTPLESTWGSRGFLNFFFICGVGAGLLNAAVTPTGTVPVVGASGAIYGLLMAFGILFPNRLIYIWGVFPVKAKYFVIGVGAIEFLSAMSAVQSNIAHVAHLGGMVFGLVYIKWDDLRAILSDRRAEKRRKRYMKVVRDRQRERESIRKEIDDLLDKINRYGIGSLTAEERARIEEISREMNESDKEI